MLIFDDIFKWEGFGGKLKLASGKCWLRIFDMNKGDQKEIAHMRPMVVVASDIAGSKLSVRSCSGHIATTVVQKFNIAPHRMRFVEYYPKKFYGEGNRNVIPEIFEAVDFTWTDKGAIHPKLKPLESPLLDLLKERLSRDNSQT